MVCGERDGTYVGVVDLDLTKEGVGHDDTCGGLTDEPVAGGDINWRAVEGVGMDCCSKDGEAGEYDKACAQRSAATTSWLQEPVCGKDVALTCRKTWNGAASWTPPPAQTRSLQTPRAPAAL